MVITRGCKASGQNKYWFNGKDLDDDSIKSVDFENINEEALLSEVEKFGITGASLRELENWKNNNVYQELDDEN